MVTLSSIFVSVIAIPSYSCTTSRSSSHFDLMPFMFHVASHTLKVFWWGSFAFAASALLVLTFSAPRVDFLPPVGLPPASSNFLSETSCDDVVGVEAFPAAFVFLPTSFSLFDSDVGGVTGGFPPLEVSEIPVGTLCCGVDLEGGSND